MSNTIVTSDILRSDFIRTREKLLQVVPFCNRQYEWDLTRQGDTVKVPIVWEQKWYTGGTAGNTIAIDDYAITSDSLTVKEVYHNGKHVKNIEEVRQNFGVQGSVVQKMTYNMVLNHERHIWDAITQNVYSGNQLSWGSSYADDSNVATENDTTIVDSLYSLKESILAQDVNWPVVFFVNTSIARLLKSADQFDNTDMGMKEIASGLTYNMLPGFAGTIDGSVVYVSNNLPQVEADSDGVAEFSFMIAMEQGAPTFVEQLTEIAVREPSNAFRKNLIIESVFQSDVISDRNKKAIAAKKVTNMTTNNIRKFNSQTTR